METIRGIEKVEPAPSCAAFGVFDGVHVGHQAVLRRMVERARAGGLRSVALTFDPHPDAVTKPGGPPPLLTTLEEKAAAIEACGPEVLAIAAFDEAFAAIPAQDFAHRVLAEAIGACCLVVGPDAVFGRRGEGDIALLRRLGIATVEEVGPTAVAGRQASSTAIRDLLQQGEATAARELLGRPFALGGVVVRGLGKGRSLGFPTINLEPDGGKLIPASGVYAGWAEAAGGQRAAALSIGDRATFGAPGLAIEAALLDFEGDLYGQRASLHFWERLREQRKFESPEALREQIAQDCQRAQQAVAHALQGG